MDKVHQNVLSCLRQSIIDDLDVYNGIILPLSTEYILKEEDIKNIKQGKSKQERAQILLDMLPDRGPLAFEVFHQSLRHHYWWLSEAIDKKIQLANGVNNDVSFVYSNLQPVSPLTVTREKMIGKLKTALNDLRPNGYVVLHGMKGCGKSCLTASMLKDKELVSKLFNNEIYWIKFGYKRMINQETIIQLNNLYHQIKHLSYPIEIENEEPLETMLLSAIKNHFAQSLHRNALLILDDVCHKEVVDTFDFDCKTLVVTSDLGVLNKKSYVTVKMDHGFTEDETLGLFAKVLDVNIDQLPYQAKLIHSECKGMPLLIAMFAAQFENFKYDMQHQKGRWEYYLNCLKNKNSKNKVIVQFMKTQEATFDMCINQLENEVRERYECLAIFSEEVNIMPKTLEILWGEELYFVDDQMLDFCHKSLAAKKWNDDLRCYVYGVHDLLLSHLKKKLTSSQLRDKHRLFIEKCRDYCNGDFSRLPNDNYCFSYIGHHLEQAEMLEEFYKLYFNFDFLQAKINHTGLSDLFIDLKKYRTYITCYGNEKIESDLRNLEHFLENHANTLAKHRLMKCLDLVQIALDHSAEGFVKKTAKQLASSRSFSLYLLHQKNAITNTYSDFCQEVTTNASTVAFTNAPTHLLVGSYDGQVILWDCENRQSKVFSGHEKRAIKKIILSMTGDYFLALSENGILKLFTLSSVEYEPGRFSMPVQSPRYKQIHWTELFETKHDDSLKTFSIGDEVITDMKFAQNNRIVLCTNAGTVRLYDLRGNLKWEDRYKNHWFGGVSFTSGDNLLHVMNETISVIRIYQKNSDYDYSYVSQFNLQLNNPKLIYFSKHPVEDNCLIIVTNKIALYFKWFYNNNEHIHSYEKYVKIEEKDENINYVAATLTYDARYLIIGNSNGIISVMKAFNPDDLITYFKGNVTSLDSYWMYYEDFHLICGSEKRWIYKWEIRADEKPKSVKKVFFDAKLGNLGEDNIIALKTAPNVITVSSKEKSLKVESRHGKIITIKLVNDTEEVIYVTESGSVIIHGINSDKSTLMAKLDCVDNLIDILHVKNDFYVLSKSEKNCLKVSWNSKKSSLINGSENVIFVHKLSDDILITISKNCSIIYWLIGNFDCHKLYEFKGNNCTATYSCISCNKYYLATLTDNHNLIIYKLSGKTQTDELKVEVYLELEYKHHLRICEFSKDEKYLAVALDDGVVSVIELATPLELGRLSLHCSRVCQLLWSPVSIGAPILLSVSSDELAWWNVSFLRNSEKSQNRRSRMGIVGRSASSPAVGCAGLESPDAASCRLPSSQSDEPVVGGAKRKNTLTLRSASLDCDEYWSRKLPASNDPERPALLGCVQLPSSCTGQVTIRVSADFSRFLTVDINGSVSIYTIFTDPPS